MSFFNTLATVDLTAGYMTAETLETGIYTTIIGMFVVFLVLIILYFSVVILSKIMEATEKGGKKEKAAPAPAPAPVAAAEAGLNPKTVAAIMSAVAAMSGRRVADLKFSAIRRAAPGSTSSWSASGVNEIINTRQDYL